MQEWADLIEKVMMNNGIIIVASAYLVKELMQMFFPDYQEYTPLITGIVGLMLSVMIPDIFEGRNLFYRCVLGMALGWGSISIFELIKKCRKK